MLVTFVASASVSSLNWPCHQNEHLKIFLKIYKKITNARSAVPRKYQLKFTFSPSTIKITHFNVGKVKKWFHEHKVFSRLEVIHHMSTSLVSDFVEEVKGGRRSCVAAFSHNWTSIKIQLKLLLNQLYCSFPALTQWWQWMALRSTLQGRHFYINQSSVLAGVDTEVISPGPGLRKKAGPGAVKSR